jgi:hypothetical protein
MIDGSRGQGRRNWCPCRRRRAAGTGWDSWRRGSWRVGSSHVRQAPIWVEEVGMTRSDRRIDRPHFRTFRRQDRAGGCHTWRCCVVFLPVSAATCDLADIHRRSHAGYRCARELSLPPRDVTADANSWPFPDRVGDLCDHLAGDASASSSWASVDLAHQPGLRPSDVPLHGENGSWRWRRVLAALLSSHGIGDQQLFDLPALVADQQVDQLVTPPGGLKAGRGSIVANHHAGGGS